MESEDGMNGTIEVTSGASITLTCSLEVTSNSDIVPEYEWSREGGVDLPAGATQSNGKRRPV